MHKCCPWFISFLLILLFTSRAVYDLVAVKVEDAKKFGFGWTFATDMVSGLTCNLRQRKLGIIIILRREF